MVQSKTLLKGEITRILPDSGAIERCPKCRRALVNDHCPVHLDVEGVEDLRVKAQIKGKQIIFNGDIIEHVLGITKEDAQALPEHDIKRVIQDKMKGKVAEVEVSTIDESEGLYHVSSLKQLGE